MRQILDITKIGKENPDWVQFSFSFFEQFFLVFSAQKNGGNFENVCFPSVNLTNSSFLGKNAPYFRYHKIGK
jgi:hypothetical protein